MPQYKDIADLIKRKNIDYSFIYKNKEGVIQHDINLSQPQKDLDVCKKRGDNWNNATKIEDFNKLNKATIVSLEEMKAKYTDIQKVQDYSNKIVTFREVCNFIENFSKNEGITLRRAEAKTGSMRNFQERLASSNNKEIENRTRNYLNKKKSSSSDKKLKNKKRNSHDFFTDSIDYFKYKDFQDIELKRDDVLELLIVEFPELIKSKKLSEIMDGEIMDGDIMDTIKTPSLSVSR